MNESVFYLRHLRMVMHPIDYVYYRSQLLAFRFSFDTEDYSIFPNEKPREKKLIDEKYIKKDPVIVRAKKAYKQLVSGE